MIELLYIPAGKHINFNIYDTSKHTSIEEWVKKVYSSNEKIYYLEIINEIIKISKMDNTYCLEFFHKNEIVKPCVKEEFELIDVKYEKI